MHELSIAISLIDVVAEEMTKLGDAQVTAVRMRLGPLSGVVKSALLFSFDVVAMGTALEGVPLRIDDVAVTVWCEACAAEHELRDLATRRCPACNAPTPRLVHGEELELIGLEIEAA